MYDGKPNNEIEVKKDIFFLSDDPHFSENTNIKEVVQFYQTFYNLDIDSFYEYLNAFKL